MDYCDQNNRPSVSLVPQTELTDFDAEALDLSIHKSKEESVRKNSMGSTASSSSPPSDISEDRPLTEKQGTNLLIRPYQHLTYTESRYPSFHQGQSNSSVTPPSDSEYVPKLIQQEPMFDCRSVIQNDFIDLPVPRVSMAPLPGSPVQMCPLPQRPLPVRPTPLRPIAIEFAHMQSANNLINVPVTALMYYSSDMDTNDMSPFDPNHHLYNEPGPSGLCQNEILLNAMPRDVNDTTAESVETLKKRNLEEIKQSNVDTSEKKYIRSSTVTNSTDSDEKDEIYLIKRKKNNESAKRSRDARRRKEERTAFRPE